MRWLGDWAGKTVRRANPKIEREYAGKSDQPVVLFSSSACFSLAKHWRGAFADAAELAGLLSAFVSEAETGFEAVEGIGAGCRVLGVDSKAGFVNVAVTMGDPRGLSCSCPRGGKRGGKTRRRAGGGQKRAAEVLTIEMRLSLRSGRSSNCFASTGPPCTRTTTRTRKLYSLSGGNALATIKSRRARGSKKPPPPLVLRGARAQDLRILSPAVPGRRKLVAVGVVTSCRPASQSISSGTRTTPFGLGGVSSLAEIDFVAKASARHRDLRYYYQGFYIHLP